MKIINSSENLTPKEIYSLTMSPKTQKMKDALGSRIEIGAWASYEDVNKKTGELQEVLAIMTPEGEIFATNSPTFKEDFFQMLDLFNQMGETVHAISVISGTSKAGRDFISCAYEDSTEHAPEKSGAVLIWGVSRETLSGFRLC